MRLAVIDTERCKYKKCDKPCIRFCPRVRSGDETVVDNGKRIIINEELCIGCGICVNKCPHGAIKIVNLTHELENMTHQYGKNTFRLYGLPCPIKGQVVGLLGANGIGKSTALQILSGKIRPNLGDFSLESADDSKIINMFKGTEIQKYLTDLLGGKLKTVYKPQQVDVLPKIVKGTPRKILKDGRGVFDEIVKALGLETVLDRDIAKLSGGELQRVTIAATMMKDADIYYFDEPSSYLDAYQRLAMAKAIRRLAESGKYVVVVEHDLATMDILADHVHIVHGKPGVYGVISMLYSARRGINTYLDGYIREDNIRFREGALNFKGRGKMFKGVVKLVEYPEMSKTYKNFSVKAKPGFIYEGEIVGAFGANALGKTTFIKMLCGKEKADSGVCVDSEMKIAYKPQYLYPDFNGTVSELLSTVTGDFHKTAYKKKILRPLELEDLLQNSVKTLSGGELQRVAIAIALSQDSDLILLDEPSAYLDVEQRVKFAKLIRNFIEESKKTCMIIDHDLLVLDYVSDRAILFNGISGVSGFAESPGSLKKGLNAFLKSLGITFREEPDTGRPRANKEKSQKDQEQKKSGVYYCG